jgi:ATPase subunit of ABC transporter with duplicated ATPase domains
MRKKISLACAVMEKPQLLLLDEPTCHIDIGGILQLRQLLADCVDSNTTVVLVSHDVDLMNDVATDVIDFRDGKLGYYTGNYHDYLKYRREKISHQLKQSHAIEKQRTSMMSSIDAMKKKSTQVDSSQASKKLDKAVKSKVKKLERHGVEKNEKGHYRVSQTEGSGMRKGSINAIGASERSTLTHRELIKLAEVAIGPVPDKAVQFDFRDTTSSWGDEPLVMVMDVGHSYDTKTTSGSTSNLIFDCVDLAIREGSRITILGENGAGKSTLLSIIAGEIMPSVGTVHFATGINIGHFHQHAVDHLFANLCGRSTGDGIVTPLSYLTERFPSKTEHEIRGELTRFGLSPKQAATNVRFLSGGERCRMCMANMMLETPQLLVLDEISNHLDVESVEALIYGLNKWNGTIVLASHDTNLVRSIGGESYVLFDGMLRRIDGGIDTYLKVFAKHYHKL